MVNVTAVDSAQPGRYGYALAYLNRENSSSRRLLDHCAKTDFTGFSGRQFSSVSPADVCVLPGQCVVFTAISRFEFDAFC
jgi:hypothetical protein